VNSRTSLEQSLRSNNEETRRQALQTMRGRPLAETRDLLFMAMADESWRVRKESVDVFVATEPDEGSIKELLELLRNDENAGLRNSAAEALIKLGTRAASALVRLLKDSDADVRKFVIDVMGSIGETLFLPALLEALSDPDLNVSSAAAEHLGNVGDARAVPDLIRNIIDNDSQFFRFSALAALGKLASHMPMPAEIIALADQEILRKGVYECLGSIGDESAAPILLKGFQSRQQSSRRAAISSWYRIYSQSSVTVRLEMEQSLRSQNSSELLPVLIESFDQEKPALSEAVTAMLGILGDLRGVTTLLEAFACERLSGLALSSLKRLGTDGMNALIAMYPQIDDVSRCAICSVLGELAFEPGAAVIRQALEDPSAMVRKSAVSAAGMLGMTDCIQAIAQLLEDADSELRSIVLTCLQTMAKTTPDAVQQLSRQLAISQLPDQRRDAAVLYATLGDSDSLSLLVKDENPAVREAAVVSLGKIRVYSCCGILQIALVDEDPDVRIAAAEALGEVGGSEVVDALTHALNDEDCWVQSAVLRSIVRISPVNALPLLKDVFSYADGLLLITCLEMLETVGSREAMDLVEQALDNDDADVMSLAIAIIARQGGEWLESNAERLMCHHRPEVRANLAGLLAELPPAKSRPLLEAAMEREKDENIQQLLQGLLDGMV